jgi:AraC-like DNA-binding protein
MHASSYKVARTEADIGRAPNDSLCIYQQLDGGGWFDAGGAEFVVSSGSLATSYSDLPYATAPTSDAGFHLRLVKIPFARCKALIERERDLSARPLQIASGFTTLFAAYFESFVTQAPLLKGAGAEAAVQTLAQLALVARGMAAPQNESSREAIRAGLLHKARQTVESNIQRPDLSPALVAGLLGISVRQLHLLFEPTGTSFARYVLARRLDQARLMLAQLPPRPVSDVAFACGFDSLATFYRSFRKAFGQAPAELRAMVG